MTTSHYHALTGCSSPDCTYSTCVNARAANKLIAAAPELAEALRAVAEFWAGGDAPQELTDQINAALTKAGVL